MRWEWDPAKADANLSKHGVDFADAVAALEDDQALTVEDQDHEERRFVTLGLDAYARVLVVVYTWRAGTVRLISARKADRREIRQYENRVRR